MRREGKGRKRRRRGEGRNRIKDTGRTMGREAEPKSVVSKSLDGMDLAMVAFKDLVCHTAAPGGQGQSRGGTTC